MVNTITICRYAYSFYFYSVQLCLMNEMKEHFLSMKFQNVKMPVLRVGLGKISMLGIFM